MVAALPVSYVGPLSRRADYSLLHRTHFLEPCLNVQTVNYTVAATGTPDALEQFGSFSKAIQTAALTVIPRLGDYL